MKTCKEIYDEHRKTLERHFQEFRQELETAAREQFPPSTRVSWKLPHRRDAFTGEVTGHMADDPAWLMVRSDSGSGHTVHAWELTII